MSIATRRQRWLAAAFVLIAGAATALSLATALTGLPHPGVDAAPGGLVVHVLPGGPAWLQGVRVGQTVVSIEPGEHAADWSLTVQASFGRIRASTASMLASLRETAPIAALACAFVAVALLMLRTQVAIAGAVAAVAAGLAGGPLLAGGDMIASSATGVAGLVLPVSWLLVWRASPRAVVRGLAVASAATALAWLAGRLLLADLFDPLEALRSILTQGLWIVVVGSIVSGSAWHRHVRFDLRRRSDVAMLAAALATAAMLLGVGVPALHVALVLGPVLAAYPIVRGRAANLLGDLVLGDTRERASMTAIEEERGRLARELHDAPLQDLAAVIRRIDRLPDLALEATTLRGIAEHLRTVTTGLRPPVLEDLGLGPALAFLAEEARRGSGDCVVLDLVEQTSAGARARLPESVELTLFRIVQEALHNALAHSAAGRITILGSITPGRVEVSVVDDGVGLDATAVREAQVRGRMGLRSMVQRAELIDAQLFIEPLERGTRVRVRWPG